MQSILRINVSTLLIFFVITIFSIPSFAETTTVFTSNATWIKPTHLDPNLTVYLQCWGGGGGGGNAGAIDGSGDVCDTDGGTDYYCGQAGGGGGGGAYVENYLKLSSLPS